MIMGCQERQQAAGLLWAYQGLGIGADQDVGVVPHWPSGVKKHVEPGAVGIRLQGQEPAHGRQRKKRRRAGGEIPLGLSADSSATRTNAP